jgi:dipeptidyl aminopeptidase/acylaminoacyl peptidase
VTTGRRAVAPYGSWSSPISADAVARGGHLLWDGRLVGDEVWWLETMSEQQGRSAVRRRDADGSPVDLLPAPWNARTRVHEYGGGSWTPVRRPGRTAQSLVFTEFTDQRIYRLDPGSDQPVPLTPEPPAESGLRYADLTPSAGGREVWCVRESHAPDGAVSRAIVAVPVDGTAALDPAAVRVLTAGSDFLAYPTASPDGRRLAWIAWNHPQMPWDGTELRVADLAPDGSYPDFRVVMGSTSESVLQPQWVDDDTLTAVSDRTGWWNLYRVDATEGDARPLCPFEADFAGPLWMLGRRWYAPMADGRLLTVRTFGSDTPAVLEPETGDLRDLDLPGLTSVRLLDLDTERALVVAAGPQIPPALRTIRLGDGVVQEVRASVDELPDAAYLPHVEALTFHGPQGREVHSFVYRPRNPLFVGPDDEQPPYVAFVHGGPTGHEAGVLDTTVAYFTSRGIGVVDVNYGGSTGYGRAYRERLRGQWGIVDVEDTVTALHGLVDRRLADPDRLAIRGGSAGGWTVLAALTGTEVFACGTSYFGVAELLEFARETHDFESRYLDGLVGPLPDSRDVYEQRAPLNHVDTLSCPVLLLQGLDDPIVPPRQAELFRDALRRKQIPHAYLAFDGESHGFRKATTRSTCLEAELSFYGQVMGFDPLGVPVLPLVTT